MTVNNGNWNSVNGVGGGIFPAFLRNNNRTDNSVKLNEDRYDVYVNDTFVGQKSLKNQGENLSDIDDFLKHQGINDFSSSLDGDHYTLRTGGKVNNIKDALEVYFNNR